jgi:hypothetical protein
MSNLILISASATVVLIVVTIVVANPDDGIGWESSVLDSMILQVLLVIVCYYRQRGGASTAPCVFASGVGRGYVTPQNFKIWNVTKIH